jgi:dipeptidase E
MMRLLLTSAGIRNPSIHTALVDLLGKPIAESSALCMTTASYGHSWVTPVGAWRFITGNQPETPMVELGWKSVGVLELTALPSIPRERWVAWVEETDVFLVNGGDPRYLHYWVQQSGLAELLPSLDAVWVGLSAGSLVMTPSVGDWDIEWLSPNGRDDTMLGLVDFSIFPHLGHPMLPRNTLTTAERWVKDLAHPAYAIDDETAIKVVDSNVEVVSEGEWTLLTP